MTCWEYIRQKECLPINLIKVKGTIDLYMITKSWCLIVKYINDGVIIYKHFFFNGLYT